MIQWLDEFYGDPDLRSNLMEAFLPAFSGYVSEAVGGPVAAEFIQSLAEAYVQHHLDSSRIQLQEVLQDADDPRKALVDRFAEWEEKRPTKVARNELVRAANAAQVQSMRERGVTRKVWVSSGGSCPYCTGLDGRTVSIEESFFTPDDEYNPDGAESPLTFASNIGHPPVHQGCDCSIEEFAETRQVPINEESVGKVTDANAEHWERDYELWAEYTREVEGLAELPSRQQFYDVMTANARSIAESSKVRIRSGRDSLSAILNDGRFKTQFETGTSGGKLNTDLRAEVEEFYFGLGSSTEPSTRPIYGYLGGEGDLKRVGQYGDIVVQLKDDVRERTTVSFYDSLDAYRTNEAIDADGPSLVPRPLNNVDWRAWKPWDPDQAYGDATSITSARSVPGYPEVQIHGGVSIDDIEEVVFTRSQPSPELVKALEDAGVAWRYDGSFVNEGF